MREINLTLPTMGLVASTRVLLGVGLGLLAADQLSRDKRRIIGWAALAAGALSTVPLALKVLGSPRSEEDGLHIRRTRIGPYITPW